MIFRVIFIIIVGIIITDVNDKDNLGKVNGCKTMHTSRNEQGSFVIEKDRKSSKHGVHHNSEMKQVPCSIDFDAMKSRNRPMILNITGNIIYPTKGRTLMFRK